MAVIPNGAYDRLEDFNVRRIYEKELGGAKAAPAPEASAGATAQPTELGPEPEVPGEKGKEKEEDESPHPNEAHEKGGDDQQQPPQVGEGETPKE